MNDTLFGFSLESQIKPINESLVVTYTPAVTVTNYKYELYKDDKLVDTFYSANNSKSTITMVETGEYRIEVTTYKNTLVSNVESSGIYKIDKSKPIISVGQTSFTLNKGDQLNVYSDVTALDNLDGNLSESVITNYEDLNLNELGLKKLVYTVTDEAGNVASKEVQINVVKDNNHNLIYIQIPLIISLIGVLIAILLYRRSIALERRLARFSITPIKNDTTSLFDNVNDLLNKIIFKINKYTIKSSLLVKYSNRFEKYTYMPDYKDRSAIDFVSMKVITSFVFLLIAIVSITIQYKMINIYQILISLVIGFFITDVVYFIKYKIHRNKVENDLLQAVIMMNNAFKSGTSITQAVLLVSTELEGSIAEEFKKMHTELLYGLSVDSVFKRFSERVKIEEATYLTASISILNKTGGNIVKVFSSIEKSLFGKKKLNLELQALTSSSKLVMYVLFLVPIFFVVMISLISNTYFMPFLNTELGLVLMTGLIIYYVLYIIVVKKIMQVRM